VAMRVAAKARVAAARRRTHERRGGAIAAVRMAETDEIGPRPCGRDSEGLPRNAGVLASLLS
jgi:hypothetical protein